jgi:hypothetical protein
MVAFGGQEPVGIPFLQLDTSYLGTVHGLAKLPYLRDSRRSLAGLGGFRLQISALLGGSKVGHLFNDTVALGHFYADIHPLSERLSGCKVPKHMLHGQRVLPFHIPFRSLTVENSPNLLVAGKSIAATFHVNAATRMHPVEWSTGVAAGAAAVTMEKFGWTAEQMLANIGVLQDIIRNEQSLEFKF